MKITLRTILVAAVLIAGSQVSLAGGPLYVGGPADVPGQPYRWNNQSPVTYWTDKSALGLLSKQQADQFTLDCFNVWHNVSTANISFARAGDLSVDVTSSNIISLLNNAGSELNTKTSIVYDVDGSLTDALYGYGASDAILGFATITNGASDGTNNYFKSGLAVLNGKFVDGRAGTEISQEKFKEAFVHEFGHLIGLDHSQINVEVLSGTQYRDADRLAGLPTMFPYLLDTPARPTPAIDDIATVSRLYPTAAFVTTTGTISGHVLFSDAVSPVQGVNLIARIVDDPATQQDESKRTVISGVSGNLFTADAGNFITAAPGSSFGSRNKSLIGSYEIPGLPPGTYTLEVERISAEFLDGSSVGPIGKLGFQFPLPGSCYTEFWNLSESSADGCSDSSTIVIAPGIVMGPNTDVILNETPPTHDAWEGDARIPVLLWAGEIQEVRA